jgi:RNA recognition motif-containing protein
LKANKKGRMIQETYSQIKDLFEPPAPMLLPTPAASTGSAVFTQMNENSLTSGNKPGSNNSSNDDIGAFETSSKKKIENENSYEDYSDDDSEDMPIFYSSLITTMRAGFQTPSLPLVGLMQPHGSSTPKEHAYSSSPVSLAASDTLTTLTRRAATILLPSSPSSRQVSLPRQKTNLEPGSSLHVSNLDPTAVTEAILYNHFCAIGPVSSVKICRDAGTSRSLGYGYVNYYKRDDARRAMEILNFWPITNAPANKEIRIAKVFAKGQPPPAAANVVVKGLSTAKVHSSQCSSGSANGLARALWTIFTSYGEIVSVRVVESDGRAYVQFEKVESARAALLAASSPAGIQIDGRIVRLESFVGREARESWSSAASNKSQQQDQPHPQPASEKNDIMLPPGLVVSSLPNSNKSDINGSGLEKLLSNSSPNLAGNAMIHPTAINSSSSSATLYTPAELVQPAIPTLPSLPVNSSPNCSHQVPTREVTPVQGTTSSNPTSPALFNHQMSLPFVPVSLPTHVPIAPALPSYRRRMQPPRGHGWTTVKILNLPAAVYDEADQIKSLAQELCCAFGHVASVHISSANPENSSCRPVYVRFFDARAAITARNVIAGLQLGSGRPLRAFLLTRNANSGIGEEGSVSVPTERVQPMVVVKHLGNKVTSDDIDRILRENCPAVHDKLFSACNGRINTSNSSSAGFEPEKSIIRVYPGHCAVMITCPDRAVATAAAAALDKIKINGSVVTACVARDFEYDDRSSPYCDKFPSRRYNASQHRKKVQELKQLEYQSQYPPLPERPKKHFHNCPQTPVIGTKPKFTHVPPSQPLSQGSAHWYIRHIPRPYVYFPMPASALPGFESRPQPTHADATGSSIDNAVGHATLVGHYYFGIDAGGVGYHVQHPMPPPVPAPLLLQSEHLVESSAERVEAAKSERVDKMGWEKEISLKIQTATLKKNPPKSTSAPETSARVVVETAITRKNSTSHLSKSSTHKASGIPDKSPSKPLLSSSLPSTPGLDTEPLVLPGLAATLGSASKPLRSKPSVEKHNNHKLRTAATATKSLSPPFRTISAESNSRPGTGDKSKTPRIPSGPAKLHQHQQTPLVNQSNNNNNNSSSSNAKDSEGMSYRQRRKLLRNRRRGRRANRAVPAFAAREK